jgi:CBS domain-containing protein
MTNVGYVEDIMVKDVKALPPSAPLFDAIKIMAQSNIGTIVVVSDATPVGILTERDIIKFLADGTYDAKADLEKMISKRLDIVSPKTELSIAFDMMETRKIRHLPVVEGNKLVGIISARDLIRYIAGIGTRDIAKYREISERTIRAADDMQVEEDYEDHD